MQRTTAPVVTEQGISARVQLVADQEARFADALARQVIEKPQLSAWMILIPVLFLYYRYRLPRYAEGKKRFAEHYLLSRKRALQDAAAIVEGRGEPDSGRRAALSGVPSGIHPLLQDLLDELTDHYTALLRAEGGDFAALVRAAYQDRTAYLLVMDRLTEAERKLYEALRDWISPSAEEATTMTDALVCAAERLRREEAERIFP